MCNVGLVHVLEAAWGLREEVPKRVNVDNWAEVVFIAVRYLEVALSNNTSLEFGDVAVFILFDLEHQFGW